ncbi:MAG: hypothetical protein IJ017_01530 [Oscillospiraceae bacterium]|nr:hypothetical protein [Oscillospiraceae bacterium]
MTTGMNLWDANVWSFIITMTLLFVSMIIANTLRNTIPFLRRLMIPSSVLGGFILLIVNTIFKNVFNISLYENGILEILTYHGLGLGFSAMALRTIEKKNDNRSKTGAFDSGVTVVATYLLQAVMGLVVTVILFYAINSFFASGILLPMGYGQGPGQAYTWGHTYEASYGFTNGTSFGLAVSSMGFVSASIGGVVYLTRLRRKGTFSGEIGKDASDAHMTIDEYAGKNEIPLSESMDKFTVQVSLVFVAYILAFLFMKGVNVIVETGVLGGLGKTVQSMIWGFQFLFGTIFAILVRTVLNKLRKKNIVKRDYVNNFMMNRISGFMFDIMVIASIAAIDLSAFTTPSFIVPLSIICILGAVGSYIYLDVVCKKVFPMYEQSAFLSLYGMLTGTASTGAILLREVDPKFESQASDNLVYHQPWAILFGFPMFLLLGVAPQSIGKCLLTLGICVVLFIAMNLILFRKDIFKKKSK